MITERAADAGWRLHGASRPDLIRRETLIDIFADSARRLPSKTAMQLLGGDEHLTYSALEAAAGQLAGALAARGIGPGHSVGLYFRRSIAMHVAMLAILRVGAAYVPFDGDAPLDRVRTCLADCGSSAVLTHEAIGVDTTRLGVPALHVEALLAEGHGAVSHAVAPEARAYVIYTSGSTGEPKGVSVSHRNACHYVRSVNETLGFEAADVVLQQASLAFDLSLEEIFVPYLVGATIAVASDDAMRDLDGLPDLLERAGVTVMDTVPTLLGLLERPPSSVRLFIVGGEACPPSIVDRYAGAGRRLLNTYGPTEATVVATAAELFPGRPVTIGRPIANYTAYVVDDTLAPVRTGETGELLIGGPGVAMGYIGQPDLTALKFVANPFADTGATDPLLYRTGDAVSVDDQGNIVFHGRVDAQVKIRGYRIELGEIEALVSREPGVLQAAVAVSPHPSAGDVLVGHVVVDESFDLGALQRRLAERLPAYMLPRYWNQLSALPTLVSGKLDRKALAALPLPDVTSAGEQEQPATLIEAQVLQAAREVLGLKVVPLDADFFIELGGHSLIAARFVSELRKTPNLANVALKDVYAFRSVRGLAAILQERAEHEGGQRADLSFEPVPLRRRFLCGLAQAVALPFIIMIVTAQWIGLLLSSIFLVRVDTPMWQEALILSSVFVTLNLGAKVVVVALKWLIIGRTKPGVYPLWGSYYFRIWLLQRIVHLTAHKFLQGSPLMSLYLRALGARVGRDAVIHEFEDGAIDLISIGDRASIGTKVKLGNVEVIGDKVYVGRITVGADAHIGNGAVIGHDVQIGDGASIGDLTAIASGTTIARGEAWSGSPATRLDTSDEEPLPPHPSMSTPLRIVRGVGFFVAYNVSLIIGLLPIFPAFYVLYHFEGWISADPNYNLSWALVAAFSLPAALVLIIISMAVVVALRWILMPRRVEPGRHSILGMFYFRKWIISLTTESMLETLNSLYATVFMRNWYRLMGARVGKGTEISASFAGRYDLIEMGRDNFIGDEAVFGDEEIRGGWMTLKRLKTGDRCFFGNSAVVPQGSVIEDDALLGVKSMVPPSNHIRAGETWLGSPSMQLPNRQKIILDARSTYEPSRWARLGRMSFEAAHTAFPVAVLVTIVYIAAELMAEPIDEGRWGMAFAYFLMAGLVTASIMYSMAVLFKWVMMGVYRPVMKPMWSWWAMRTEAVAVLYGGLASKVLLEYLRGTPFLPWLLRPFGAKVGKGTWINSTDICEFDCTEIADHAVINMGACPQTHLYEDRIMKVGRIVIGRGATVGTGSTVLYDATIGEFAQLRPLTLVMKGESIPPHTVWSGIPAQHTPPGATGAASEHARGAIGTAGTDPQKAA